MLWRVLFSGYGLDPALPSKAFTNAFLQGINNTAGPQIGAAKAYVADGGDLWVGETAMAWHSGRLNTTNTFLCVCVGQLGCACCLCVQ